MIDNILELDRPERVFTHLRLTDMTTTAQGAVGAGSPLGDLYELMTTGEHVATSPLPLPHR